MDVSPCLIDAALARAGNPFGHVPLASPQASPRSGVLLHVGRLLRGLTSIPPGGGRRGAARFCVQQRVVAVFRCIARGAPWAQSRSNQSGDAQNAEGRGSQRTPPLEAYLTGDEPPEVVVFCPECGEREFED
jgi:hypothetical protein